MLNRKLTATGAAQKQFANEHRTLQGWGEHGTRPLGQRPLCGKKEPFKPTQPAATRLGQIEPQLRKINFMN
jgi:hypothetical protein